VHQVVKSELRGLYFPTHVVTAGEIETLKAICLKELREAESEIPGFSL
jgi:hypothetical protein